MAEIPPNNRRFDKGFFTRERFAVAAKYLAMPNRARLFKYGGIAALALALVFLADAFIGRASFIAGPLSARHALFAKNCSSCHTAAHGAPNANCQSCHQKSAGERQVYGFAKHYQYRSADVDRSSPHSQEMTCGTCHREHQGRQNTLQNVADNKCVGCHDMRSFHSGHPEFEFARKKIPNPSNLTFQHILHVREVMKEQKLSNAENACLSCHTPKPDGRTFQPLSYAKACDRCHLGETESTPYMPLKSGGRPGVATLAEIRKSASPGTQWAEYWNADEFSEQGGAVKKRIVYHADPWVLYNLQQIRHQLYPGAELADLINTTAELPPEQARTLYEEATGTLQKQIESLRGNQSPDVQNEVSSLTQVLKLIQQRIDEPYAPLDETKFAVTNGDRSGADERAYAPVIDSLTKPCQLCHTVQKATIRRVKTDLRTMVRAEFDHRAHVLHAKCLDCHNVIPFRQYLGTDDKPAPSQDNAQIVNLPTIEKCQSCHTSKAAPATCTTCHLFHPDREHWASLTR
ncbi:MAG TPA: cytochrome c3 family protein [Gemmatimonadaceae bacterium]|nr:cytochrome c3 family protein [Gemmatimonadaceae bacterium]